MQASREITDLTICRALFAAWVFCYHVDLYLGLSAWLGPLSGWLGRGYRGVDGFFLLSGLILARTHPEFSPRAPGRFVPKARLFLGKRLARIYPVHVATLALLAVFVASAEMRGLVPRDANRFGTLPLLENVLLIHGWGFAVGGTWNYPSWSVSTEWAGYLLFPVLWRVLSRCEAVVSAQLVFVGFMLLGLLASRHHQMLNLGFSAGLLRFFPEFLIGLCTARLVPVMADVAPARGLALAGAMLVLAGAGAKQDFFAVLGLWLLLFAFALRAEAGWPPLPGRPAALLAFGRLSYAFYMSFAVAELLLVQGFRLRGWVPAAHAGLFAGGMLAVTLALALALHVAVETPARRRADRLLAVQ
jgi:peptidoglycan/LPS O-acetylase OafA/YrhL